MRAESSPTRHPSWLWGGRRRDKGLHLGDERTAALDRHRDAGARGRIASIAEEQAAGVGQADDAVVDELEAADLVGGPEAVLDRAHEPKWPLPVALEVQHHVDEVLECARTGD